MNGISALIRRDMRADAFSLLSALSGKDGHSKPGGRQARPHQTLDLAGILILDFSGSKTVRNKCWFKLPSLWCLLHSAITT